MTEEIEETAYISHVLKEHDKDIDHLKNELRDHERETDSRFRTLETRTAVNERDIKTVMENLKNIQDNTRWILRLIIGGIVLAGLGWLIQSNPDVLPTKLVLSLLS